MPVVGSVVVCWAWFQIAARCAGRSSRCAWFRARPVVPVWYDAGVIGACGWQHKRRRGPPNKPLELTPLRGPEIVPFLNAGNTRPLSRSISGGAAQRQAVRHPWQGRQHAFSSLGCCESGFLRARCASSVVPVPVVPGVVRTPVVLVARCAGVVRAPVVLVARCGQRDSRWA